MVSFINFLIEVFFDKEDPEMIEYIEKEETFYDFLKKSLTF